MTKVLYVVLSAVASLIELPPLAMLPCIFDFELDDTFTYFLKLKHSDIKKVDIDTQIMLIREIMSKAAIKAEKEILSLGYTPFSDEFPLLSVGNIVWLKGNTLMIEFLLNTEHTKSTLYTNLFYNELEEDYEDYDI